MSAIEDVELAEEDMADDDNIARAESDLMSAQYQQKTKQGFDNISEDIEYKQMLITPEAKQTYNDIDRDMVGANLKETDIVWVKVREKLIGQIQYLINKGLDLKTLKEHFKRGVYITLNVSLSRDGYLRENITTQGLRFIRGKDKQDRPTIPYGVRRN